VVVDPCLRVAHDVNDAQVRADELAVRHRRRVEDESIDAGDVSVDETLDVVVMFLNSCSFSRWTIRP
jgi:hypothetical protein